MRLATVGCWTGIISLLPFGVNPIKGKRTRVEPDQFDGRIISFDCFCSFLALKSVPFYCGSEVVIERPFSAGIQVTPTEPRSVPFDDLVQGHAWLSRRPTAFGGAGSHLQPRRDIM